MTTNNETVLTPEAIQRTPAVFNALLAYYVRPCDKEGADVVRAILGCIHPAASEAKQAMIAAARNAGLQFHKMADGRYELKPLIVGITYAASEAEPPRLPTGEMLNAAVPAWHAWKSCDNGRSIQALGKLMWEHMLEAAPTIRNPLMVASEAGAVPEIGPYDIGTSNGGRGYVAEFFAKRIKRYDFTRYIQDTLAADFACALAKHLRDTPPAPVEAGAVPVALSQYGYQQIFDAIAAATSARNGGAVIVSVQAFRNALAVPPSAPAAEPVPDEKAIYEFIEPRIGRMPTSQIVRGALSHFAAPPAESAQPAEHLRKALEKRGFRTDGDMQTLAERCRLAIEEDGVLISTQRTLMDRYKALAHPADACTDPDNCRRCQTQIGCRGNLHHAGIPLGQPTAATADAQGDEQSIKDVYIRVFGSDTGWLDVQGSYFITGFQAAAQGAQWQRAQRIADTPAVDEALEAFANDATGDNGVGVVAAVLEAVPAPNAQVPLFKSDAMMKAVDTLVGLQWTYQDDGQWHAPDAQGDERAALAVMALRNRLDRIHVACTDTRPKQAVGEMIAAMLKMPEWSTALSRQPSAAAGAQTVYVPIAVSPHDEVDGRHPNDKEPSSDACRAALHRRGDDKGQGLCSYWKWGFRSGWNAALAAAKPEGGDRG